MKKKPKISYRDLGVGGQGSGPADPASGAPEAPVLSNAVPAPDPAPVPNAPTSAPASDAPRRVSSPVEVAAILRVTPPVGMPAVPAAASSAPTIAVAPDAAPRSPDSRPLTPSVEDYAVTLMRRLEAMAPDAADDADEIEAQRRPLRERVRDRQGLADLLMFRIGDELFAADLASVEEAVTLPEIHHLPEMPVAMLGAFNLRGRLTPVYSPSHVIGVPLRGVAQAALLVHAGERRLGLAVDDVEDVFQVDLATVREAPGTDDADGILLGVAHHGTELVAIVDAEALVAACVTGHAMEITA
jgi:purine-binding chemotaxis protein CheW